MNKLSYCAIHDTYPEDNEPCWQCVTVWKNKEESDMKMIKIETKTAADRCKVASLLANAGYKVWIDHAEVSEVEDSNVSTR